jgi:hypothetical protein
MKHPKTHTGLVFLLVLLSGIALHFLYDLVPIFPCSILAPVNESLFQHSKLLFWPVLLGAFWLKKWDGASMKPRLLGVLVSTVLLLAGGWLYHITLGGDALWVDILLYLVTITLAFVGIPRLCPAHPAGRGWDAVVYAFFLLAVALVLFTFWPPNHLLFTDLSGANTWTTLPC